MPLASRLTVISALVNFAARLFFSPSALTARQKGVSESDIRKIANPAALIRMLRMITVRFSSFPLNGSCRSERTDYAGMRLVRYDIIMSPARGGAPRAGRRPPVISE